MTDPVTLLKFQGKGQNMFVQLYIISHNISSVCGTSIHIPSNVEIHQQFK